MSKVALLLPYVVTGPEGPRVYLQLHSRGHPWRLFGGHVESGETPLQAVVREAKEELLLDLDPRALGEGWTFPQLLCRLRFPFARVYLYPVETKPSALVDGLKPAEGAEGRWWPIRRLPRPLSTADRLLIKTWVLRRFVLNQPYVASTTTLRRLKRTYAASRLRLPGTRLLEGDRAWTPTRFSRLSLL